MKAVFDLVKKYYPKYWSKERLDVPLAKKKLTKAVFDLAKKYYPKYWSKERLDVLLAKKKLTQEEYDELIENGQNGN